MEIGKKALFILALALALAAIGPVAAYVYFWETEHQQIPTGIVLQTPDAIMELGIYWDNLCTQPVVTIDFGEMWHPNETTAVTQDMYIRNEGNVSHTVYWNSTLSSETAEIADAWNKISPPVGPLNGTVINEGAKITTRYKIDIDPYATVGTYNWTLTVWAEHTH